MAARSLARGSLLLAALALAACSSNDEGSEASASKSSVTQRAFDRNDVLDDKSLHDAAAMSAEDVQKFLEKTPWGHASVLATFEEGGKSAAAIITEAAKKHGINPLEMIVRLQMEQGLVEKKTASADALKYAFGCGCPHAPVCEKSPEKYTGFANQAECAAGTLGRSMDRALTTTGTVSGWARNRAKSSEDGVSITPKNAATAALYTYTPWVGEAGGGKKGVGGASLHYQVWNTFAEHASYGEWAVKSAGTGDGGEPEDPPVDVPPADAGKDAQPAPPADAGADSGAKKDGSNDAGAGAHPPADGRDDADVLKDGNAPPADNNAPPPRSKPTKGYSEEDLPTASESDLAGKKKTTEKGCSQSGASGAGNAALVGLAAAIGLVVSRRRKR